jgi:hypothetical protein
VCQAVLALGSKVTYAPVAFEDSSGFKNNGSTLTFPVNQSLGPDIDFCDPFLKIFILILPYLSVILKYSVNRAKLLYRYS